MSALETPTPCSNLAGRLAEVLDPELRGGGLERLRAHAEICAACSGRIAAHRRLEADLRSVGGPVPAPGPSLRPPVLPDARPAPVLRLRWAAAAAIMLAAGLAVGFVAAERTPLGSPEPGARVGAELRFVVVEDPAAGSAVPDEELLRLSCGWDGVASLRPALDQ